MKSRKSKLNGIFYNGKYGEYNCKSSSSKDNAYLEFKRRASIIKLAENNINAFEQIINNNIDLYHGTNLNALPGILKYGGMLSENESYKSDNPVLTGEEWSRTDGCRRNFISFTDQMNRALEYSSISPSTESTLTSFGIIIGISSGDIKDLNTFKVDSDIPELGITDKVPISKIKTIFVPNDKIDFVSKVIGDAKIQLASLDLLSPSIEKVRYGERDIKKLATTRKTSGIKKIFTKIKELLKTRFNEKNIQMKNGDEIGDRS